MIVLGIDPGTTCGWCVFEPFDRLPVGGPVGRVIASGRWDLKPHLHEGGGMRYVRLQAYLHQLHEAYAIAIVCYEQPGTFGGASKASPEVVHGVIATVQAWLERRGIPYRGLPFSTSKRHATGSGAASKIAMCRAVRRLYGVELYARPRKFAKPKPPKPGQPPPRPPKPPRPDEHDDRDGPFGDEDEADAILVAHAGTIELGGVVPDTITTTKGKRP